MVHANAALTPRQRLRLARAVVEDGWTIAYAAAVLQVAWPTAKRWAVRYAQAGPAGMVDRSSRSHRCPRRTPRPLVRRIVHLARMTGAHRGRRAFGNGRGQRCEGSRADVRSTGRELVRSR